MHCEPQEEHHWLTQLVGEWTFETETVMEPGKPPDKFAGTESVRTLGGVWILCEGSVGMPSCGMDSTVMSLGYDPARRRFLGTFIGSMMTHLWIYDGALDAAEKVLTLDTVGPSFAGDGKMAKYQDIIEIKSPDHRIMSARFQRDDGQWQHFMTANYHRKK